MILVPIAFAQPCTLNVCAQLSSQATSLNLCLNICLLLYIGMREAKAQTRLRTYAISTRSVPAGIFEYRYDFAVRYTWCHVAGYPSYR